jgi:hypothetical protein
MAVGADPLRQLGVALVSPNAYVIPFELASVLLLGALIGALMIAREKKYDPTFLVSNPRSRSFLYRYVRCAVSQECNRNLMGIELMLNAVNMLTWSRFGVTGHLNLLPARPLWSLYWQWLRQK